MWLSQAKLPLKTLYYYGRHHCHCHHRCCQVTPERVNLFNFLFCLLRINAGSKKRRLPTVNFLLWFGRQLQMLLILVHIPDKSNKLATMCIKYNKLSQAKKKCISYAICCKWIKRSFNVTHFEISERWYNNFLALSLKVPNVQWLKVLKIATFDHPSYMLLFSKPSEWISRQNLYYQKLVSRKGNKGQYITT